MNAVIANKNVKHFCNTLILPIAVLSMLISCKQTVTPSEQNSIPAKTVYVWKQSNTIASCFAMADNGSFLTATLNSGRLSEWRDLSQPQAPLVSTGQFATYLRSNAVPVGSVPVKDSVSGAFGTVTKIDNNNIFFTGAMRKQGRTYQVAFAIVDGIVPSAFTEWALT